MGQEIAVFRAALVERRDRLDLYETLHLQRIELRVDSHEKGIFADMRYLLEKGGLSRGQCFSPPDLLADAALQSFKELQGFVPVQKGEKALQSLHEIVDESGLGCLRERVL